MSKNIIGEPDKYELASVVTKNSRTGITSNRRLLVIKGGKLYYYSTVPKNFSGDTKMLQLSHQLPKCSIDIMNIKRVNGFDVSSPFFSIDFNAGSMMGKEDIRNSSMREDYNFSPKETKQQITWQFTCDNQFIKQRWVTSLSHLIQYYRQQNLDIQNFMLNIQNTTNIPEEFKNSSNGSFSSRSSIKMPVPWRESAISRRSYNPDKGFEFKDSSSPPLNFQKIEDISFLKKSPSEAKIKSNNHQDHQFQMIIQEEPTKTLLKSRSEDHKIQKNQQITKKSAIQPTTLHIPLSLIEVPTYPSNQDPPFLSHSTIISTPPLNPLQNPTFPPPLNRSKNFPIAIQELSEQSIQHTPIKQHNLSFYESQVHTQENRKSIQKTLADLKIFNEVQEPKRPLTYHSYHMFHQTPTHPSSKKQIILDKTESIQLHKDKSPILIQPAIQVHEPKAVQVKSQFYQRQNLYPFHYLWGEGLKAQHRFNQRIEFQKELLNEIFSFKERAIQSLSDWLQSKAHKESRYPIIQQNSRFIVLQIGNIHLKIASMVTQKVVINGNQKIFYNEDSIKNLKRQFKIHQNLFKMISKRLKTEVSLKLRIPLSIFIQYRGVVCIATKKYSHQQPIQNVQEDQWSNERNVLLEEGYKLESFTLKRISKYLQISLKTKGKNFDKDQQNLKQYLKKLVLIGRKEKHHNLVFDPPVDRLFLDIASKENASTSVQSLQRYVKGLKLAKNLQGSCPKQEIISALQKCIFCKQLRKIYRSAQGEINETHFFNLIFKREPAIINLLKQSDCQIPADIKGQILSFIEHYFGIILQIDEKAYKDYFKNEENTSRKQKDVFISSTARPLVREYLFQGFQLIQSWSKLTYYIQNNHPLGKQALQTKREVYRMTQNLSLDQCLQLIYDEGQFYYYEADFIGCIKKCKQFEKSCPPKSTRLFGIYLLMMKSYSEFSQTDFSITFKKANELIEFNYGSQNSSLVSLYSLAAFYYQKLSQKLNTKRDPSLLDASIRLIKQAQQLCNVCFGNNSKQYLDILLDASRLYQNTDINVSLLYFQQIKKICQENSHLCTPQNIITILSYEIEQNLKRCLMAEAEASLTHALTFSQSKISLKSKIHLYKLQYEVGLYGDKFNHCQTAIEKLWQLGTYEKLQALELAYKAAFKQCGIFQSQNLIDQQDSVRYESQERAIAILQQQKYKNKSLINTLINAIENKDTHLLTLTYFLIRKY